MKILIAYDGSRCADAALVDLTRAGLPDDVEAEVLSVLELWAPPPAMLDVMTSGTRRGFSSYQEDVERMTGSAAASLREHFPSWKIGSHADVGVPARLILDRLAADGVDLVVLGSEGHTALGRFFLGSVSQKVALEAPCSVRVARGRLHGATGPIRIVVAFKSAPSGEEAVDAVAARLWPAGTEVRLVTAVGPERLLGAAADRLAADLDAVHRMAADRLTAAGVAVSSAILEGDPRKLITEVAEAWHADAIFVGTRDLTRTGRWALGSVSSAILSRAHCSVEIARSSGA